MKFNYVLCYNYSIIIVTYYCYNVFLPQIAPRYWFYFCLPVWSLLVVYAAIHLVLIYTFPFTGINNLWMDAYNKSGLYGTISADDV